MIGMPAETPGAAPAIIVAGMHRSGTSLTASLLADAGVHLGDQLLGPGHGNPVGHFEDLEIYEFHQRVLMANGLGPEGFTTQGAIPIPDDLAAEAQLLAASRRRHDGPWGWKEPRTTLFLDFWAELLPEARFLLIFRRPWEVVDSLFRRGDPRFADDPSFAVELWCHYNRTIEQFHKRHADRCLVVEVSQLVADPAGCSARAEAVLGIGLGNLSGRFREDLLIQRAVSSWVELFNAYDTDVLDLYRRLQLLAGSEPMPAVDGVERLSEVNAGKRSVAVAFAEWQRAAVAEATITSLRAEVTQLTAAAATVSTLAAESKRYAQQAEIHQHQIVVAGARASAWEETARHARGHRDSLLADKERLTAELERAHQQLATVSAALARKNRPLAVKFSHACSRFQHKLSRELRRLSRQFRGRVHRHPSDGLHSNFNG